MGREEGWAGDERVDDERMVVCLVVPKYGLGWMRLEV